MTKLLSRFLAVSLSAVLMSSSTNTPAFACKRSSLESTGLTDQALALQNISDHFAKVSLARLVIADLLTGKSSPKPTTSKLPDGLVFSKRVFTPRVDASSHQSAFPLLRVTWWASLLSEIAGRFSLRRKVPPITMASQWPTGLVLFRWRESEAGYGQLYWTTNPFLLPDKLPTYELHLSHRDRVWLEENGKVEIVPQAGGYVFAKFTQTPEHYFPLLPWSQDIIRRSRDHQFNADLFNPKTAAYEKWIAQWPNELVYQKSQRSLLPEQEWDVIPDLDGWLVHLKAIMKNSTASHVVQMGDAIGRGPDSEATYDELGRLQEQAEIEGKTFERLIGNAEWRALLGAYLPMDRQSMSDQSRMRLSEKIRHDILKSRLKMATVVGGRLTTHIGLSTPLLGLFSRFVGTKDPYRLADEINDLTLRFVRGDELSPFERGLLDGPSFGLITWMPQEGGSSFAPIPQLVAHLSGSAFRRLDFEGQIVGIDIGIHEGRVGFARVETDRLGKESRLLGFYLDGEQVKGVHEYLASVTAEDVPPNWTFVEIGWSHLMHPHQMALPYLSNRTRHSA